MINTKQWLYTWPSKYVGFGSIISVFEQDDEEYYTFYDEINGGVRISKKEFIIDKPNGRMMNMLTKAKSKDTKN